MDKFSSQRTFNGNDVRRRLGAPRGSENKPKQHWPNQDSTAQKTTTPDLLAEISEYLAVSVTTDEVTESLFDLCDQNLRNSVLEKCGINFQQATHH